MCEYCDSVVQKYFELISDFFFELLFLKWEFWLPSHPKFHYSAGSFVSAHSFSLCFGTGGFYFSKWCHILFFKLPYICHTSCRQVGSAASFIPHFHQPKLSMSLITALNVGSSSSGCLLLSCGRQVAALCWYTQVGTRTAQWPHHHGWDH